MHKVTSFIEKPLALFDPYFELSIVDASKYLNSTDSRHKVGVVKVSYTQGGHSVIELLIHQSSILHISFIELYSYSVSL